MATFTHRGDFNKTEKFLNRVRGSNYLNILSKYGKIGVNALASATPVDTGKTANCWIYEIEHTLDSTTIYWTNTNVNDGVNVAIILNYGHGTGNGGFVQGRDYISPSIQPIFDQIAKESWREVTAT